MIREFRKTVFKFRPPISRRDGETPFPSRAMEREFSAPETIQGDTCSRSWDAWIIPNSSRGRDPMSGALVSLYYDK
ncbi:hypothetical protein TNIN_191091 [Trichonephila inaurata madagascariensis]|uniref:Uncharacterized protein n=1 Tax=Trichonephila inaurata madagascariensis TaxID=2747483 RepID=A0A8X7CAP6_9ARAC|nr:hypothetical protein TNIN_191091 [Trichonephila inaurata madagascariensis]